MAEDLPAARRHTCKGVVVWIFAFSHGAGVPAGVAVRGREKEEAKYEGMCSHVEKGKNSDSLYA